MTPAGGDDPLGAPTDGNTPINSIVLTNGGFNYHVGQYTVKNGDADGTELRRRHCRQALSVLNASTDPKKLMVFASDGLSNQGGLAAFNAAVAAIQATGTIANSIAIGAAPRARAAPTEIWQTSRSTAAPATRCRTRTTCPISFRT